MESATIQPRMTNPMMALDGALPAAIRLSKAAQASELPAATAELVHLRASQINGCGVCVDMHSRGLRELGQSDERIFAVGAWRDTPYYDDAERAALALTEEVTRLSDQPDPVSDEVWAEAARHYDEQLLAGLVLEIAMINLWNRVNVATRQIAGAWTG
jgi:AhpD family alkylhydroperoxidase